MQIHKPPGQTAACSLYVHFIVSLCPRHLQGFPSFANLQMNCLKSFLIQMLDFHFSQILNEEKDKPIDKHNYSCECENI